MKDAFIFLPLLFFSILSTETSAQTVRDLVPGEGQIIGWEPVGEPEYAEGQDLYLLIDGGAEIFHEYGFAAAAFQIFGSAKGDIINLEIYEMADTAAAYGIYTFRSGSPGKRVDLGCQAVLASYYLNFWSSRYVISVVGMDSSKDIIDGIMAFGGYFDRQLPCSGGPYELTRCLPEKDLRINRVKYIEGNIGLFNQYLFDRKNIFGVRIGVSGTYTNHMLLIFEYDSEPEAERWLITAKRHLLNNAMFEEFKKTGVHLSFLDAEGKYVLAECHHKWIIVVIGVPATSYEHIFNEVEDRLSILMRP